MMVRPREFCLRGQPDLDSWRELNTRPGSIVGTSLIQEIFARSMVFIKGFLIQRIPRMVSIKSQ